MSWAKKIDSKKYAIGTVINLGFATYAGWPVVSSIIWLAYLVLATVGNHYFTVVALSKVIASRATGEEAKPVKLLLYLLAKTLFLASAFLCLLIFNRDKVLQGLLIYIFQLIIFALSIKNIGNLIKKGTPP
jgi:hypothetical protein